MKYYMHVNYIENLFDIPEICKLCREAGFDGIELRGKDRSGKLPLDEYLPFAYKAAKDNNLDVVFGCNTDAIKSDSEARNNSLDELVKIIKFSGEHNIKILNVFAGGLTNPDLPYFSFEKQGSTLATDEHFNLAAEFFKTAGDEAAKYDIDLCFEMHNNYLHDLAEPTKKLLNMIDKPNVKANFDMGNLVLNNNALPIDECIEKISPHIGYVHLKNMIHFDDGDTKMLRGCALDDGDINHYDLVRRLIKIGYKGPWTIENVMTGDKQPLMKRDLNYLKSLVNELS